MEPLAEDLAGVARTSDFRRAFLFFDSNWRRALATKDPLTAQYRARGGTSLAAAATPQTYRAWDVKRPLHLTIVQDALAAQPVVVERLRRLARVAPVTVDVSPRVASIYPWEGLLTFRPEADGRSAVGTTRGSAIRKLHVEGQQDFEDAAIPMFDDSGLDVSAARQWIRDLAVHTILKNDVFVTANAAMLRRRHELSWLEGAGICSPHDALVVTEAFLREQDEIYLRIDDGGSLRTHRGSFITSLIRGCLPVASDALASCLSPARRAHDRIIAEHLAAIVERFRNLCVAHDELFGIAQREGLLGGGTDLLDRQMYHLQQSIVLFTGALDVLAWVAADLDRGTRPTPSSVSWAHLVASDRRWVEHLSDERAIALRAAAMSAPAADRINLAFQLRHAYQHRHPLAGGVASWLDESRLVHAQIGVVSLALSLGDDHDVVPAPGLVNVGNHAYLVPHLYQRGLMVDLARTVEHVLGSIDWPEANWWHAESSPAAVVNDAEERRLALWLFGWPDQPSEAPPLRTMLEP